MTSAAKQHMAALLQTLPDDCTLEDIQYHLYVLAKIRRSIQIAEQYGAISQAEAERRLGARCHAYMEHTP